MRLALLLLAACNLQDDLQRCGDLLCPPSATCAGDRCIEEASLSACVDRAEGDDCRIPRIDDGVCHLDECVARGCGNGVLESGEICDDGNRTSDDGCAGDCLGLDTCPPLGSRLSFRGLLQQVSSEDCSQYSESRDTGVSALLCSVGVTVSMNAILVGPIGGPYDLVPELTRNYLSAWVLPEGDGMIVLYSFDGVFEYQLLRPNSGTWVKEAALTLPTGDPIGRPSRGPEHRIMTTGFVEYALVGSEVTLVRTHTTPTLTLVYSANLSADGLRLFVTGLTGQVGAAPALYVLERATLDDEFGPRSGEPLADLDTTSSAFVTDNCDKMYVSQFGSMFYTRQTP